MEKNTVCLLKVVLNELNCLVTVNLFLQELIRTRPASDESDLGGLCVAPWKGRAAYPVDSEAYHADNIPVLAFRGP